MRGLRILFLILACFCTGFLLACPLECPKTPTVSAPDPKTVVISAGSCKEDRQVTTTPPDLALLDCTTADGKAIDHVLFPREEWQNMKRRGVGAVDAGPGK
jgi:hypothetical protein